MGRSEDCCWHRGETEGLTGKTRPQDIPTRYPDPGIFEKHKDANRDRKIQDIQGSDPKSLLFERYPMILICFSHVLDLFYICFRHVLDMFYICFNIVQYFSSIFNIVSVIKHTFRTPFSTLNHDLGSIFHVDFDSNTPRALGTLFRWVV